jgi:ribonuclease BN (tRNA processing enzyme)
MQPFLQCLGYRIESASAALCYAGDSGGVRDSVIALARKADILVHMMHFASGTEPTTEFRESTGAHTDVAETARRAEVGALVLTHFTPVVDTPGTRERLIAEMAQIYRGPIIWGEDLMTLSVPHASTVGID